MYNYSLNIQNCLALMYPVYRPQRNGDIRNHFIFALADDDVKHKKNCCGSAEQGGYGLGDAVLQS